MPGFDHFDLLAPIYDRVIRPPADSPLRELLDLPSRGRLLDAAGGTGRATSRWQDWEGTILVLDRSLPMLRQAAAKGASRVVAAEAEALPLRPAAFDRIVIVDSIHHLANPAVALRELWRCLAPGGRLVVEEPDIARWAVKVIHLLELASGMRSDFRPPRWIAAALSDLGASTEVIRQGMGAWILASKPDAGGMVPSGLQRV
jgi:ubiquinone/menaquinone biosynthesis C-methylase UbiE